VILLDTHALLWWLSDRDRLPAAARQRLDDLVAAGEMARVSAISCWEIAMLVDRGRLELTMPAAAWVHHAQSLPFLEFVPLGPEEALAAVALPGFPHRDPADRMIVATALRLGATLVTADQRLRDYPPLPTLWD
jgi:PIN domain nuclease of toxin-antitoxin system